MKNVILVLNSKAFNEKERQKKFKNVKI